MKNSVVIVTHHKTGTVWMDGVFRGIAKDLGVALLDFDTQSGRLDDALHEPFILLNSSSNFGNHQDLLSRPDVRVLHLIRDPRDVVISAMHYHKRSREQWLHQAVHEYDCATYHQRLNQLSSRAHQYVYEMEHSSAATIRDMVDWQYGRPTCLEARYETLIADHQLVYWRKVMTFLGFEGEEVEVGTQRFWQNSLFGGLSRLGNKHVRCGTSAQWRKEFTASLACTFISRFPGALQKLGYEPNHKWILELERKPARKVYGIMNRLSKSRWAPAQQMASLLALFAGTY